MRDRILFTLALLTLVVGAFLFSIEITNAGRTARGLSLATMPVGGIPLVELPKTLEEAFLTFEHTPIRVTVSDTGQTFTVMPQSLGVSIAREETLHAITSVGRNPNIAAGLFEQIRTFVARPVVTPIVSFDEQSYSHTVTQALTGIDDPAVNAALVWNKNYNTFTVAPAHDGYVIDRSSLKELLVANARTLSSRDVSVNRTFQAPAITPQDATLALQEAQALMARAPLVLVAREKRFTLERSDLANLLTVERDSVTQSVVVNADPVRTKIYLTAVVAPKVNHEAQDAKFAVENGKVVAFALSREGETLDVDASVRGIREGIKEQRQELQLSLALTTPAVRTGDIDMLGIIGLVGKGETDFKGSTKNRINNIKVGTAKFNGALLKPGEEFSFAKILGPVTEEAGYKPELVILKGVTTPQLGGGLCQVGTTAFRAAVLSGFPVTERRPHAYIVHYYNPIGFDATVYPPHPDLRFINDTAGYLLIQTKVEGTKLTFEFYGTPDNRQVELTGPSVYDRKADGSAKATLTVRVTMSDGTQRSQIFNSTYRSPSLYPVSRRNPLE